MLVHFATLQIQTSLYFTEVLCDRLKVLFCHYDVEMKYLFLKGQRKQFWVFCHEDFLMHRILMIILELDN